MAANDPDISKAFDWLLSLPEARQRRELGELSKQDPERAVELERLLAAHQAAPEFLDHLDAARAASLLEEDEPRLMPKRIGGYRLIEEIGRGGLGVVYLGERVDSDFDQKVALKLIKHGMDSESILRRFRVERRILASLTHPNIAGLTDGGLLEDGRPWFAMEYIEGRRLTDWCDQQALSLSERVRLFGQVCRAVQYAHSRLIVHRDLKPDNILVTADGTVKLLDFGIAKLLAESEDEQTQLTLTGVQAMTPEYAAPEQIRGEPVTVQTDIYALGVVLYQLLTGHHPFREHKSSRASLADAICQTDPSPPSAALAATAPGAVKNKPIARPRQLRGDLDTIVMKAMARDPERRYASAEALAEDIDRHLQGLPVRARRTSRLYALGRFIARHRLALGATLAVILSLAIGLSAALWQAEQARQALIRAEAVQDFLLDIFLTNTSNQPDPVKARETTARELLDIGHDRLGQALDGAPEARFEVLSVMAALYYDLGLHEQAVELQRQRVELAGTLHGNHSVESLEALIDLAAALHTTDQVEDRLEILEAAGDIVSHGRNIPPALAGAHFRQMSQHFTSTDIPRAIVYARRSVAKLESLPPSADLAESHYLLGVALSFSGDHQASAAALARAVEASHEAQGFPNPSMPRLYALLSHAQYRLLKMDAARESARLSVTAAYAIAGPEHIDTLQTTLRLGRLLFDTGETHEGLKHLASANQMALNILGPDDPFHTPQTRLDYGFALVRAGDAEAGLAEIQQAIDNRRRHRPGTAYLAQMLESAAIALIQLDRGKEADAFLDEAEAIRRSVNQSPGSVVWNAHVAARVRRALDEGQVTIARDWLAQYGMSVDPSAGESVEQILRNLLEAEIELEAGNYEKVQSATAHALGQINSLDLDHFLSLERARALYLKGTAEIRLNQLEAGCRWLAQSLEIRERLLLETSPTLARSRAAMTICSQA